MEGLRSSWGGLLEIKISFLVDQSPTFLNETTSDLILYFKANGHQQISGGSFLGEVVRIVISVPGFWTAYIRQEIQLLKYSMHLCICLTTAVTVSRQYISLVRDLEIRRLQNGPVDDAITTSWTIARSHNWGPLFCTIIFLSPDIRSIWGWCKRRASLIYILIISSGYSARICQMICGKKCR